MINRHKFITNELIQNLLCEKDTIPIHIKGNSMYPFIRHGDTVFAQRVCPEQLRVGDIALIKTNDGFIVHRIVKLLDKHSKQRLLITRGDRNIYFDPIVLPDNFLGKIICCRRGEEIINLETPIWRNCGLILLISKRFALPCLLLLTKVLPKHMRENIVSLPIILFFFQASLYAYN